MLKAEKIYVSGFQPALRGMRNPKNSWDRSDLNTVDLSGYAYTKRGSIVDDLDATNLIAESYDICINKTDEAGNTKLVKAESLYVSRDRKHIVREIKDHDGNKTILMIEMDKIPIIGEKDLTLMKTLCDGGPVHGKFARMINVYIDITASFDFWKEADTYRFGKECNSCSTMHTIAKHPVTIDNYSTADLRPKDIEFMKHNIEYYNEVLNDDTLSDIEKTRILSKINMTGFEQKRTLMLSYETIHNMCTWRRCHKLEEWRYLCNEIFMNLPYFKFLYFTK